ncbi:hypothetical protein CHS0354_043119 [Potamilus streckersoni]|uniref:Uncharacterized protein n=1 Tax=Potamilus streckersoni TaxID=2493646 RepID=A0AAE0SBI5_9BIVA|nr:hypothetical protein CHS0354_043119 [Potamilus streckersoni]
MAGTKCHLHFITEDEHKEKKEDEKSLTPVDSYGRRQGGAADTSQLHGNGVMTEEVTDHEKENGWIYSVQLSFYLLKI